MRSYSTVIVIIIYCLLFVYRAKKIKVDAQVNETQVRGVVISVLLHTRMCLLISIFKYIYTIYSTIYVDLYASLPHIWVLIHTLIYAHILLCMYTYIYTPLPPYIYLYTLVYTPLCMYKVFPYIVCTCILMYALICIHVLIYLGTPLSIPAYLCIRPHTLSYHHIYTYKGR